MNEGRTKEKISKRRPGQRKATLGWNEGACYHGLSPTALNTKGENGWAFLILLAWDGIVSIAIIVCIQVRIRQPRWQMEGCNCSFLLDDGPGDVPCVWDVGPKELHELGNINA